MTVERSRIRAGMYRIAVGELQQILEQCPYTSVRQLITTSTIETTQDGVPYTYSWQELCTLQNPDTDYALLMQILDTAIARYPHDSWLRCLRGRALWANDYFQAALEDLHIALHGALNRTLPYILLGETYYLQNRYDAACAMLDKAIEAAPRSARAYLARALVYKSLAEESDTEEAYRVWLTLALEDLECALMLAPDQKPAFASLAHRIKQQITQ